MSVKRWFRLLLICFHPGILEGRGWKKNVTVEAFLSFWLSRYVLPSGPEDGINAYVFPLAVRLARGKKLSLGPLYLGLLYARVDECVRNITSSMGGYDVFTHVDSAFIQIFLWKRFGRIVLRPAEFDPVVITEEMVGGKSKRTKRAPYMPRA